MVQPSSSASAVRGARCVMECAEPQRARARAAYVRTNERNGEGAVRAPNRAKPCLSPAAKCGTTPRCAHHAMPLTPCICRYRVARSSVSRHSEHVAIVYYRCLSAAAAVTLFIPRQHTTTDMFYHIYIENVYISRDKSARRTNMKPLQRHEMSLHVVNIHVATGHDSR